MQRHGRTKIVNAATAGTPNLRRRLRSPRSSDSVVKFKLVIAVEYTVSGEIYTTNPKG